MRIDLLLLFIETHFVDENAYCKRKQFQYFETNVKEIGFYADKQILFR